MKAEVISSYEVGSLLLTTKTVLFARKVKGTWLVHLNYHNINARYQEIHQGQDGNIMLLEGTGLTVQSGRNVNVVSGFCSILGLIGVVNGIITTVQKVLEILADVRSLIPTVLEWLKDEASKIISGQEPVYLTRLSDAQRVLQLMKDGVHIDRRLPRWREKTKDK